MTEPDNLSPPKRTNTEDPGARELDSESEEHFSDAQSAPPTSPVPTSPIPRTRVEKVSDEPSYGEVPGTEAYRKREGDAAPDEIALITDLSDAAKKAASGMDEGKDAEGDGDGEQSPLPGGQPIPKTVVEEAAGEGSAHSQEFLLRRMADAPPDEVLKSDGKDGGGGGGDGVTDDAGRVPEPSRSTSGPGDRSPEHLSDVEVTTPDFVSPSPSPDLRGLEEESPKSSNRTTSPMPPLSIPVPDPPVVDRAGRRGHGEPTEQADEKALGKVDGVSQRPDDDATRDSTHDGDDFDDFEEGGSAKDFDDFAEDDFQQAESAGESSPVPPHPQQATAVPLALPVPDFHGLDLDEMASAMEPYLDALFPPTELQVPALPPHSKEHPIFPTARSASLWSQLVAPPPLSPPDWIRSRIRRLFLVSLGVPVDLDEILPASKQKKLVLPSARMSAATGTGTGTATAPSSAAGSPRGSSDRMRSADARLGQSQQRSASASASRKRKGPLPAPDLDLTAAQQLCMTTREALDGMTEQELREHVKTLREMEVRANAVLEYWQERTDEKIGDREAFEGVIGNLVKHAQKVRS